MVVALLRTAASEYEAAIVEGRIGNPVEYQDSRGFVWQARIEAERAARQLKAKDAEAYRSLMTQLDALQPAWPSAMPPQAPVKSAGEVSAAVSRIELLKGRFT